MGPARLVIYFFTFVVLRAAVCQNFGLRRLLVGAQSKTSQALLLGASFGSSSFHLLATADDKEKC